MKAILAGVIAATALLSGAPAMAQGWHDHGYRHHGWHHHYDRHHHWHHHGYR